MNILFLLAKFMHFFLSKKTFCLLLITIPFNPAILLCFKVFKPMVGRSTLRSCFFLGNLTKTPFPLFFIFLSIFCVPSLPSIAITLLFKQYNYKFKLIHVKKILKTLVEGWNLFTYQLSTVLFANTNITMLGLLSTPEAVGVYSIGEKIVRLVISLVSPISSAIFPNISKLLSRSFTDGVNKLRYILKIGGILFFFISLIRLLVM